MPALRTRPLLGLDLLSQYQYKDGKWQGQLYDPESGKTYKSQITLGSDGKLQMRGYIGMPMLGRTAMWTPVSSCSANIVKMLALAKLDSQLRLTEAAQPITCFHVPRSSMRKVRVLCFRFAHRRVRRFAVVVAGQQQRVVGQRREFAQAVVHLLRIGTR